MRNGKRILAAVAAAVAAATWAAPAAEAAPPRSSKTTWATDFPYAGTFTECSNPAPSTTCTYTATAAADGAVDLAARWQSNPLPNQNWGFGRASAQGSVGGYVSVPTGATQLTVSSDVLVTRDLSTTSSWWAVSFYDEELYALPPGCWTFSWGWVVTKTLAASSPVTGAPPTLPAGSTDHESLLVAAPAGQTLEKGTWTIRTRLHAHAQNGQDQPLQDAAVSGAVDVTSMTIAVTVPGRP